MSPQHLTWVCAWVYLSLLSGGFVLLLALETLFPRDPTATESERTCRILRHFALWTVGVLVADGLVGDRVLLIPTRLFDAGPGLFHFISLPMAVLVVVGVVLVDLGEYAFHRLSHRLRWLWLIHAVHHADKRLDVTTTLRFHPAETTINVVWKLLWLQLLGLPLWLVAVRGPLMVTTSFLQHTNLETPEWLERLLAPLFITPRMHRAHHATEPAQNDTAFGEIFSIWDRLFGTMPPAPVQPIVFGLPNLRDERWHTFPGMLAAPLTARHLRSL